jgi:hypothetical protein
MKKLIFNCLILITFFACSKKDINGGYELRIGPASLGGGVTPLYFFITDQKGKPIQKLPNEDVPKVYFMMNGKKVYNSIYMKDISSKPEVAWTKFTEKTTCVNDTQMLNDGFNEIFSDKSFYVINEKENIEEFYIEWRERLLGKIELSTLKKDTKFYQKVVFDDNVLKSSNFLCFPTYIFKTNL